MAQHRMSSKTNGDERSHLLGGGAANTASTSSRRPRRQRTTSTASIASIHVPQAHDPSTVLAIICGLIFIGSASGGFFTIPMTRIFEERFCREYYSSIRSPSNPLDEELCKVDIVQSRLAYLFAINAFIDAAIGCLVAMPWGLVADRIGRRPIYALAIIGMNVGSVWQMAVGWFSDTLPIRLYWIGPLCIMIGGGNAVLNGTLSSMLADILPESERAIGFMQIHVASMLGNLCSPAISSILMPKVGPWPLLCISITLPFLSAIGMLFVPETLTPKPNTADAAPEQSGSFNARLSRSLSELKDSLSMLKSRSVVLLMLSCVFLMPVIYCTLQFLSQFVSKRYHIRLAYTGYIQGAYGAAHVLVILLVMPYLSKLAMRPTSPSWIRMADEKQRDLVFTRWSFVALALGTLVMAFSTVLPTFIVGLFIMSFGSGAGSFIPSTLAFFVDKEHRTRMFSLVGIMQIVGSLYAMPMLAGLFTVGMRLGSLWIGLPYLGVATLCGIAIVLQAFVRLSGKSNPTDDEDVHPTTI